MTAVSAHTPYQPAPEPGRPETVARYEGELGFWDLLDVVNPLQHVPVVNWIYREITGDTIQPPARIAGAAIYGGPIGMVGAIADEALAEHSGRHAHEHVVAMLTGDPQGREDTPPQAVPTPDTGPLVAEGPLPGSAPGAAVAAAQTVAAAPVRPAGSGTVAVAEGPTPAAGEQVATTAGLGRPLGAEGPVPAGAAGAPPPVGIGLAEGPAVAAARPDGSAADAGRSLRTGDLRFFDLTEAPRHGGAPTARPAPPGGPVVGDSRIDAALMALAARSETATPATASSSDGTADSAEAGTAPGAIPASRVPQAMAEALARYYDGGATGTPRLDTAS